MEVSIPNLARGMVVVTPYQDQTSITPNKTYIIEGVYHEFLLIKNDLGVTHPYESIMFIEADVYFTMLMFLTLMRAFNF